MKSLFDPKEAKKYENNLLELRAYTSRLLGANDELVLQGGGNTSVKLTSTNFFQESLEVLYVKGSGHDLKTITPKGFAPVKMETLLKLARLPQLSDTDMVREQKLAMIDQAAPGPSVEAILHAIIPQRFVDHTHADAVVTLSNTKNGRELIEEIYGDKVLVVPYVMPGFILAKKVYEMTRDFSPKDWEKLEGMILLNHGIFTFHHEAQIAYENMLALVSKAEDFLKKRKVFLPLPERKKELTINEALTLAKLRAHCNKVAERPMILQFVGDHLGTDLGPLTPDHVIYTKSMVAHFNGEADSITHCLDQFAQDYQRFFDQYHSAEMKILDRAPRVVLWKNQGVVCVGKNPKLAQVVKDISFHTAQCAQWAQDLGGHRPLGLKDLFQVEYWELEQAKLKKIENNPEFEGQVVLITGAASGIGKKTAEHFLRSGAAVVGLDIKTEIQEIKHPSYLGVCVDLTNFAATQAALIQGVERFGGIDIVVLNAGIFPPSQNLEVMDDKTWNASLNINLTSPQRLLTALIPFLKLGHAPSVAIIASKNVPAPGPGAAHYSVAKAGLTQLARVAALELAPFGINVNVIHPNNVFDTGIWTTEVLQQRARHYGISVDEYKKNNLLKTEITSQDVAQMVALAVGPKFRKTTGAQIPLDGGNDRVI